MTFVTGFHSACNLVRLQIPSDIALAALVAQLDLSDAEAMTALAAAQRWVGRDPHPAAA